MMSCWKFTQVVRWCSHWKFRFSWGISHPAIHIPYHINIPLIYHKYPIEHQTEVPFSVHSHPTHIPLISHQLLPCNIPSLASLVPRCRLGIHVISQKYPKQYPKNYPKNIPKKSLASSSIISMQYPKEVCILSGLALIHVMELEHLLPSLAGHVDSKAHEVWLSASSYMGWSRHGTYTII